MATDAVPARASSDSIVEAWWFRFLVRIALALLAFWMLSFASDRYVAFGRDASKNFRFDDSLWLSWVGAMVAAGFLFGLATWLPFGQGSLLAEPPPAGRPRAPAPRSLLVDLPGPRGVGWVVGTGLRFDGVPTQPVLAALAGVAIASGFRPKHQLASDL